MTQVAETIYRKDYKSTDFLIDSTELTFDLTLEKGVIVKSRLAIRRNPSLKNTAALQLDGIDLELQEVKIDGKILVSDQYQVTDESLLVTDVPEQFIFECETLIFPEKNTSLEGLYRSQTMFCTQCEAEGFRKITYYLDRPDVLSEFKTHIIANEGEYKTLLSNGNCIADILEDGLRKVTWHDPFKKPCYLFALVAGNLESIHDTFKTFSGRVVDIYIYVEQKDLGKCDHAMDSLKRSMKWDEDVYGREYDLDIFMIVAVDDFNMGAMENKGLNIFNTSCVLAHPETTTDAGFQRVEAVVAHEYFHNWSGNRVTCRDWFQLSLKEGFTVYRDSEFSADMNSRAVKRIEDASFLRVHQFAEDAGPMAHPVRPDSFIEISNFYTLTIYEKGSELVRMMANILGPKTFRKACDLYFSRHDGQAVTCEDFVCAMEDASGVDLKQFRLWYEQAGTPLLEIDDEYDESQQLYRLKIKQIQPNSPGQNQKKAMHIPLKIALLGEAGHYALKLSGEMLELDEISSDNTEKVLAVTKEESVFEFSGISEKPVPSLLRDFSAPVNIRYEYSNDELAMLMVRDDDGFSRFDATQTLSTRLIKAMYQGDALRVEEITPVYLSALSIIVKDERIDGSFKTLMLQLPELAYLLGQFESVDPELLAAVHKQLRIVVANALEIEFLTLYDSVAATADVSGQAMADRAIKNLCLSYLLLLGDKFIQRAYSQYSDALNMTDRAAALKALIQNPKAIECSAKALDDFYRRFESESLVVNMWLQLQVLSDLPDVLGLVESLMTHQAFDITNPNKVRALFGGFTQNIKAFHKADGSGYRFLADQVILLNKLNPQIASRLLAPLTRFGKIEASRAQLMKNELQRIADEKDLSKDVYEVVCKSLVIA